MVSTAGLVLVLAVVTQVLGVIQDCMEIPTEPNFKMEDVEGNWYPMEIVLHRNDSKIYGIPTEPNCPTVTFSVGPKNKKTLTMVWNSTAGDLDYKFTQKGLKSQWQSSGEQTGTLVSDDQYKHYGGIVRVLKLDDDYMFLSFCSSKLRLLSTVAFSRTENMPKDVYEETLGVLEAKHYKRAKEIHTRPCQEEDSSNHLGSTFLLILITLTVPLWH
ncbi:uncharacterized protein LOC124359928 isoform X2 [Homalodisca vitripennis]|nr:uncharacterized protein LOC124359928 isoform X2 [Homalodisca vitripennis]